MTILEEVFELPPLVRDGPTCREVVQIYLDDLRQTTTPKHVLDAEGRLKI